MARICGDGRYNCHATSKRVDEQGFCSDECQQASQSGDVIAFIRSTEFVTDGIDLDDAESDANYDDAYYEEDD